VILKLLLKKISEKFSRDGFSLFVSGPQSFSIYLNKWNFNTLNVISDCDLIYLAKNFENVDFGKDGYSAVIYLNEIRLNFQVLPDCDIHKGGYLKKSLPEGFLNIESFFYIPLKDKFYDPFGVYGSLKNKELFFVEEKDFWGIKDVLKGIYFSVEFLFDFKFSNKLDLGGEVDSQVLIYFFKILTSKNPHRGISLMDNYGLLEKVIPEIATLKGCPQDKDFHPEGDVFVHTLECFKYLKTKNRVLALSMLLHDIGKPETIVASPSLRFPMHAVVGAKMGRKISKRLGFSDAEVEELMFYIKNHLLGAIVRNGSMEHLLYIFKSKFFENLLKLYRADILGSLGDLKEYKRVVKVFDSLKKECIFFD